MSEYVPERGYRVGRMLATGEPPWPLGWESNPRIDDGHAHDWELVAIPPSLSLNPHGESVVRCGTCHVPRCGHSRDRDPCMERRHHDGLHITLKGSFEPLGGYLANEATQ